MSSWTDTEVQFNPYIQQQPVEALVSVGTELQRRYDEGVQRIQSSVDRIAGLDIARDVDKQYLQGKLDELGDKLKFVAAGDFSDRQLVNSVTGMTSKVGKDGNIQNAVISTARYRGEVEKMETDREAGKLDPSNEYVFNKQANQWFNNENVGAKFSGGYIPHFDVFGFAKETFDAVKPDGMSFDQIFEMDAEGNPVKDENGNLQYSTYMTRLEEKGLFPQKVKETLAQVFSDPRVIQQLSISGQYTYKDFDSQSLAQIADRQRYDIMAGYDEEINRNLLKKGSAETSEDKEKIQQTIDKLRSDKSKINESYSDYVAMAYENPDAVRASLYKDDVRSRYTTMFGHVETSRKIMDSPAWQASFNMQKEANVNTRFYEQLRFDKQKHADSMRQKQMEFEAEYGDGSEGGGQAGEWFTAKQTSDVDRIKYANDRFNAAATNFRSAQDDFIWEMVFSNDSSGQYANRIARLKAREGVDDYGAISIILAEEAKKAGKSVEEYKTGLLTQAIAEYENMSPDTKNESYIKSRKYENYHQAKRDFKTEQDNKAMIDDVLRQEGISIDQQLSMLNVQPQKVKVFGEDIVLDNDDIYDLAIYAAGKSAVLSGMTKEQRNEYKRNAGDAEKRLEGKGKKVLIKAINQDISNFFKATDPAETPYGEIQALKYGFERSGVDWSQVIPLADLMRSTNYSEIIKKQGDVIQRIYSITPKQAKPLLTEKAETNRGIVSKVAAFAGAFQQGQASNESSDFKDFRVDVSNPNNNNFAVEASRAGDKTKIEIVQYDEKNERVAGMTITPEQARLLNIDANNLFESPEVVNLRNRITRNGNQTSVENPESLSTYRKGDYYFGKSDFTKLSNSSMYDTKVNIRQSGGVFYPYVYMSDGEREHVFELQGTSNLEDVVTALKNEISPSLINQYLNEKYAGKSDK